MNISQSLNIFIVYIACLCFVLSCVATLRMAGAMEKSTEVMAHMQKLVKVPEIQAAMNEMSKEMMKV